ncbi:MAG: hypothetical protein OHK005_12210 [Candidatus Methylacidiphilales bacterium]
MAQVWKIRRRWTQVFLLGFAWFFGDGCGWAEVNQADRYNLRVGPVDVRVQAGTALGYSDNINFSETNPIGSMFIEPNLQFGFLWDITELNQLRLNLGLGYRKYFDSEATDTNGVRITPDSAIEFEFYVGKQWRVVLFDAFRFDQDPVDFPTVSNTFRFDRFENRAGFMAYWEVNPYWTYSIGYTNELVRSTRQQFNYLDRIGHIVTSGITWQVNPDWQVGVSGTASWYDYDQSFNNNGGTFTVGPFFDGRLTDFLRVAGGVSFVVSDFETGGRFGDRSNVATPNAYLRFTHEVNASLSHSLEGGRRTGVGLSSNTDTVNYVRHQASWLFVRDVGVGTTAFAEFGDESGGILAENYTRYGAGINLSYQLTKSISAGLRYNYITKESDRFGRSYDQNQVVFDLSYRF